MRATACTSYTTAATSRAACVQATVQAALALSPGDAVKAAYSTNPTGDEARRYTGFATEALTIAVFEILIAGTLGTLLIRFFAPLLLEKV